MSAAVTIGEVLSGGGVQRPPLLGLSALFSVTRSQAGDVRARGECEQREDLRAVLAMPLKRTRR